MPAASAISNDHVLVPVRVAELGLGTSPIIQVACGFAHSAALTADGEMYIWGKEVE